MKIFVEEYLFFWVPIIPQTGIIPDVVLTTMSHSVSDLFSFGYNMSINILHSDSESILKSGKVHRNISFKI